MLPQAIVLLVVHAYREDEDDQEIIRIISARAAENMKSADIGNRQWTESEFEAVRKIAARQKAEDDSHINFEDIPRLTKAQLASMVRLRDVQRKVSVSVRLDPQVLDWLKSKGEGHLTRINSILTNLMEAEQRVGR